MGKKTNIYYLTLKLLQTTNGQPDKPKQLELEFENHDKVFGIIERLQEKDPSNNKQQATEFAIGLKMFSEVMLKNQNHPLFEELQPAFAGFMKQLKSM